MADIVYVQKLEPSLKDSAIFSNDPRLQKIQDMIVEMTRGNYSVYESISEKGDELDAILTGLNTLAEELKASGKNIKDYQARITRIMDVLLKYTVMDFSEKAEISEIGDELDAIAVGLNTLAEELAAAREAEAQQLKAARESEERYRVLVEGVKDYAIFRIDPEGYVVTWNKGAEAIKGYKAEEIIGKHFSIFYTKDEIERGEPEYNLRMAKELGRYETESIRMRKGGETFYADVVFTALRDDRGNLLGFTKITRDITERKKAEEQIRESRDQVETIISNAPTAVVVINQDAEIIRWNSRAEKVFGWKADEIIGLSMFDMLLPAQYANEHKKEIEELLATGETQAMNNTLEIMARSKNGTEFPVEMSLSAARSRGEYIFIAFINDITERKKAEDEVKSTRDFLDTILENIPNMVFVKDAKDLRFLRFNRAGEKLLGYTREELIGKNDYDFFPKQQADFFTSKDREVLNKRDITDIPEEPVNTLNGVIWLHTKKIPIFDAQGQPLYMLGISEDITERKATEEKVRRLNRELMNNVSKLESANKELESFSYSVSHDLRAPLRAIHGYTSILLDEYAEKLDEDGKGMMNSIQSNAKKMGQLIDDLLAFSRLGKKELQKKPVDMNKLAETVIQEVLASYPNVKPEIILHPLHSVSADYNLMAQVFTNLISNAVKYSARVQHPRVEIGSEEKGKNVIYYIKDNGVGFNMDYYNKLFGVFQRLHDAGEFEGTGVGLAIVKRIIDKHGGKIWAESEPDKGATFFFSLKRDDKPVKSKPNA